MYLLFLRCRPLSVIIPPTKSIDQIPSQTAAIGAAVTTGATSATGSAVATAGPAGDPISLIYTVQFVSVTSGMGGTSLLLLLLQLLLLERAQLQGSQMLMLTLRASFLSTPLHTHGSSRFGFNITQVCPSRTRACPNRSALSMATSSHRPMRSCASPAVGVSRAMRPTQAFVAMTGRQMVR